jgi:hypothetical protein
MKFILGSAVALTISLAACDKATTISDPGVVARQPSADALVSQTNERDVPWSDVHQNPCTGDMVTVTGTAHIIFHSVLDDSGGGHISTDTDVRGTGLGFPSGMTYTVKDWFTDSQQTNGSQFSWRDERDLMVMGARSVDNYIMHFVFKYTQNANGVPTVVFDRPTERCVG